MLFNYVCLKNLKSLRVNMQVNNVIKKTKFLKRQSKNKISDTLISKTTNQTKDACNNLCHRSFSYSL